MVSGSFTDVMNSSVSHLSALVNIIQKIHAHSGPHVRRTALALVACVLGMVSTQQSKRPLDDTVGLNDISCNDV